MKNRLFTSNIGGGVFRGLMIFDKHDRETFEIEVPHGQDGHNLVVEKAKNMYGFSSATELEGGSAEKEWIMRT